MNDIFNKNRFQIYIQLPINGSWKFVLVAYKHQHKEIRCFHNGSESFYYRSEYSNCFKL